MDDGHHPPVHPEGRELATLSLLALGIVFGDIGTSPLYALQEALAPEHGVAVVPENVIGVLSLVVWALVLVVSVKYLVFVLRADHHGEGGVLALTSLVAPLGQPVVGTRERLLVTLGLFGAALVYGDGMITPAISVLSAVEGLGLAVPAVAPWVEWIAVGVLFGLFAVQRHGTAGIGRVFGPITLLWFAVIGGLGLVHTVAHPEVLGALSPVPGVRFLLAHGWRSSVVLGSVFLVVTGGEALYADLGHFGPRPIRVAWFTLVLPALLLNYFGQGALLLSDPSAIDHLFFRMAPGWALLPLIGLATAATIIASQALISGAFSLTMQAVQLGWLPRVRVDHTSASQAGQIYVPVVNAVLLVATVGLVLGFGSSSALAAAYGIAVTATMATTTLLFGFVAHHRWGWRFVPTVLLTGAFLAVELAFLAANALKITHGGWFPLLVGAGMFTVLSTWKRGKELLGEQLAARARSFAQLEGEVAARPPSRVPGDAVFMFADPRSAPPALLHNLQHNHVLHERVVLLSVVTADEPYVDDADRVTVDPIGSFWRVVLRYGFMDALAVPEDLGRARLDGRPIDPRAVTWFLGQETILPSSQPGMAPWREHLFGWMNRNKRSAATYFALPPDQVVELGTVIEI
jgi:KUP system potassium uptake protein